MKISIIVPTYNRSTVIIRAIDSVLNQIHQNFELIVVDDGSTDGTFELLNNHYKDPRIVYLRQENKGVSAARNVGIDKSTSEWIAFLDSDDEWLPKKLSIQVEQIETHKNIRFFHSNENWIRNGVKVNIPKKFCKNGEDLFKRSLDTCLISPSTVVSKKCLLYEHGLFDTGFEICEDYDLWLKILANQEIGFSEDYLVNKYGGHEDQLSTKHHSMDLWRVRSLVNLLQKNNDKYAELIQEVIEKKVQVLKSNFLKHNRDDLLQVLNHLFTNSLV